MIRAIHIYADVIELRYGEVVPFPPLVAPVIRIPHSAVIPGQHVICVFRIDPHIVEVTVCASRDIAETLAPVRTHDEWAVGFVDLILVFRIDDEVGKVERSPHHALTSVECLPGFTSVIGAIESVLWRLSFDERVDNIRV